MFKIKEKLTCSIFESRYLYNNVYMGIEEALKIDGVSQNNKLVKQINLLKSSLMTIKDPSVYYGTPPPLDLFVQKRIHKIGIEVFYLIKDYLPN